MSQPFDSAAGTESGASAAERPPHHHVTVAAAHWTGVFEFVHLFRAFRMAINPAKIAVALAAVLLVYGSGRLFDLAWGPQVFSGEIEKYQTDPPELFRSERDAADSARRTALPDALMEALPSDDRMTDADLAYYVDHPRAAYRRLVSLYEAKFLQDVRQIHEDRLSVEHERQVTGLRFGSPDAGSPADIERAQKRAAAARLLEQVQAARQQTGRGIFEALLSYEFKEFDALVDNTLGVVRLTPMPSAEAPGAPGIAVSAGLASKNPERLWKSDTIVGCLANMTITASGWLFSGAAPMQWRPADAGGWHGWGRMASYRGLYLVSLVILVGFWLGVVAFCGAMVCRMSALEFAGIDPPGPARMARFAAARFWNFVKAPLMPFVLLLLLAVVMGVVGLVGAVPGIGEVLLGIGMIVLLAAGFVVMLLLLGVLGGFNLFYPAMAAEGADSFDAMSRSFAYVYARPWRLIFYTIVSLFYGAITFLFMAFALYLLLAATHAFAGWGTDLCGWREGAFSGLGKLETLWPAPHLNRLAAPVNWWAMSWPEYLGALALHGWLFLLLGALVAFVISFYFSSHAIIYALLRRSVDGQSLSEVFREGPAELRAAAPASATAPPPTSGSPPATVPAAVPASGQEPASAASAEPAGPTVSGTRAEHPAGDEHAS